MEQTRLTQTSWIYRTPAGAKGKRKKKFQPLGENAQERTTPLFNEPFTDADPFAKKGRQAQTALIKKVWEIDSLGALDAEHR